jgi:hypothetical protein
VAEQADTREMMERHTIDADGRQLVDPAALETTVAWLTQEFPGWDFEVDAASGWQGSMRPLWIARSEGHHPQAELTAAKLHTRLTEYLERQSRRGGGDN